MSFTGVTRPGHAAIRSLGMDESVTYYTERLGLIKTDEDEQGRAIFYHDRRLNENFLSVVT